MELSFRHWEANGTWIGAADWVGDVGREEVGNRADLFLKQSRAALIQIPTICLSNSTPRYLPKRNEIQAHTNASHSCSVQCYSQQSGGSHSTGRRARPGVVTPACNLNTWEEETGGLRFQPSRTRVRPCLKNVLLRNRMGPPHNGILSAAWMPGATLWSGV